MSDVPGSGSDGLRVSAVRLRDDTARGRVVIDIDVLNELDRTAHVHATPRIVKYDAATHHLLIELSDENLDTELLASAVTTPKFKAIDPRSKTTMHARLPRHMHQLVAGTDPRVPDVATLHIHEAEQVEVRLAWSDTPFYPDPRDDAERGGVSVNAWQKGTLHGQGRRVERP
jgi:hypothetical protein